MRAVIITAVFLYVIIMGGTVAVAHENHMFKHATESIQVCGVQYYNNVTIWTLTEDRGYIGVIFTHGLLHITRPYKSLEELKGEL